MKNYTSESKKIQLEDSLVGRELVGMCVQVVRCGCVSCWSRGGWMSSPSLIRLTLSLCATSLQPFMFPFHSSGPLSGCKA